MNKVSTANNDADCPAKSILSENYKEHAPQLKVYKERLGPVKTAKQEAKEQSGGPPSTSRLTSCSHQRRWSTDCCHDNSSPVITVKKNLREPQPPQRSVSLLRCHTPSRCPRQRYSSPITGIVSTTHPSTSSSSSVQTSVITGHDPLGWKLRPKSRTSSNQVHAKRLSLQMPLPVTIPDPDFLQSNTSPTTQLDPIRKTTKSKSFRRHHSDSLAFLRSMPAVTLEELREVQLRCAKPDDVSREAYGEEKAGPQPHKKPPAVPEKSPLARKIAQHIAHSWQQQMCAARKIEQEEIIYSVIMPKAKTQQAENHCSLYAKINGMHLKSDE
ncbi:uncharacterized protein LOC144005252 [Festucalex cinctus]